MIQSDDPGAHCPDLGHSSHSESAWWPQLLRFTGRARFQFGPDRESEERGLSRGKSREADVSFLFPQYRRLPF